MSEVDIGWIAGIIDGEGCIMLHRTREASMGRSTRTVNDRLQLKVSSIDPRMLQKLRGLVGGRISAGVAGKGNRRMHWEWSITNRPAQAVLRLILPHLTVKKEQAEVALEYAPAVHGGGRGHKLDPAEDARREHIKDRLRLLKRASFEEAV